MRARYLALSPYNLVRDHSGRAAAVRYRRRQCLHARRAASERLDRARRAGAGAEPSLFAYFQDFACPIPASGSSRKGFIGLGAVEDYSRRRGAPPRADAVRSEEGPPGAAAPHARALRADLHAVSGSRRRDRPAARCSAPQAQPTAAVTDEYGAEHRLWRIADPARIAAHSGADGGQEAADRRRPSSLRDRAGVSR